MSELKAPTPGFIWKIKSPTYGYLDDYNTGFDLDVNECLFILDTEKKPHWTSTLRVWAIYLKTLQPCFFYVRAPK